MSTHDLIVRIRELIQAYSNAEDKLNRAYDVGAIDEAKWIQGLLAESVALRALINNALWKED